MRNHTLRRLAVAAAAAAGIAALTAGAAHADWPSGNSAPPAASTDPGDTYAAFSVGVGRSV